MLAAIQEYPFVENKYFAVSDIFYQRAGKQDNLIHGVDRIDSEQRRGKLIGLLRDSGEPLCKKLGISYIVTPEHVHNVVQGGQPQGDLYFCDMLSGLYTFQSGTSVLDFGCSSGRVIRNLKAAFPDIQAYGCDPRETSIEFIASRIPDVDWFVSNQAPPIADGDYSFDLVFAISVWSHFSEERALEWFDEMARLIVPGGKLIFSTHGKRSAYHFCKVKNSMPVDKAAERIAAIDKNEFHFRPYPANDLDEHWGMAFIPEQWVREKLADNWETEQFLPGLAMTNQDVYVLKRR